MTKNQSISEHLKDCFFLKIKKEGKEPSIPKGDTWKDKTLSFSDANKKLKEGFNVGLVCGKTKKDYKLLIVDCDNEALGDYCEENLPSTYTEASTSGGMHYVFKTYDDVNIANKSYVNVDSDDEHFGEVRIKDCYVVCTPSVAINKQGVLKPYQLVKDIPLAVITEEEITKLLLTFTVEKSIKTVGELEPSLLERVYADEELKDLFEKPVPVGSRSEREQTLCNKLRARDFTKEDAFHIILYSNIGKMKEKPLSYWSLMWDKAVDYVTNMKEEYKPTVKGEPLTPLTFNELINTKPLKEYLIEGTEKHKPILGKKQIVMFYGDTTVGKSYLCTYQGLCVASGKPYLGRFKTKKSPVLYISAENIPEDDAERMRRLRKGSGFRSRRIPFYYLQRKDIESITNNVFKDKIIQFIEDRGIKLLYLDTILPLVPGLEDNSAKDVTLVFNQFLKPVCDRTGVTIVFLHHTDKNKRDALGSTKWRGNADKVFRVDRNGLDNTVSIHDEKGRSGESADIKVIFDWGSNYTKVYYGGSEKARGRKNKGKKLSVKYLLIQKLKQHCDKTDERKTIIEKLTKEKVEFSKPTLDRALKEWRDGVDST